MELDFHEVNFPCPSCSKVIKVNLNQLRDNEPLTCPYCKHEAIDEGSYRKFLDAEAVN